MPSIRTTANGSTATAPAPAATPAAGPPRLLALPRRRRPAFVALAVALLAAGGGTGAAMIAATDSRAAVLAIARPVPPGAVLTPADLTRARIGADPALRPVPAAELPAVLGSRAAVPLRPGTLLTRDEVTSRLVPAAGQQLLGVALKPGQLPGQGVTPGTRVLLVSTPAGGDTRRAGRRDPGGGGAGAGHGARRDHPAGRRRGGGGSAGRRRRRGRRRAGRRDGERRAAGAAGGGRGLMLVAICSAKGSPGVSVAALALASVWPSRVVLAECDPAGGDLRTG